MRTNLNRKSFDEDKAFKMFVGAWIAAFLVSIAFWVGIIYVAIHFIAKFW